MCSSGASDPELWSAGEFRDRALEELRRLAQINDDQLAEIDLLREQLRQLKKMTFKERVRRRLRSMMQRAKF